MPPNACVTSPPEYSRHASAKRAHVGAQRQLVVAIREPPLGAVNRELLAIGAPRRVHRDHRARIQFEDADRQILAFQPRTVQIAREPAWRAPRARPVTHSKDVDVVHRELNEASAAGLRHDAAPGGIALQRFLATTSCRPYASGARSSAPCRPASPAPPYRADRGSAAGRNSSCRVPPCGWICAAASAIASASARFAATGFCSSTCLPASMAATACGR